MVDGGGKQESDRSRRHQHEAGNACRDHFRHSKKGDVLGIARIAATMASKRTSDLIPLCHPLALTHVSVGFEIDQAQASIRCTVRVETQGKTGVEMEGLTAVQVGLLTIYDMSKAIDHGMVMSDIRVQEKHSGESGAW